MPLAEELQASGRWLFRRRGYLPLALLVLFAVALRHYTYLFDTRGENEVWDFACLGISIFGATIRAITVGQTPRGTSGRNRKKQRADVLNTTGMYSIVRHPLYLGNFLASLGACLFLGVWWLPLLFTALFALYYERIILAEEEFLKQRFGPPYLDWCNTTPAFFPRLGHWRPASTPFSLRKVLREEPQTFLAAIAALYALRIAADFRVDGRFEPGLVWNVMLAGSLAVFLALRLMRRFSNWLADREIPPAAHGR